MRHQLESQSSKSQTVASYVLDIQDTNNYPSNLFTKTPSSMNMAYPILRDASAVAAWDQGFGAVVLR